MLSAIAPHQLPGSVRLPTARINNILAMCLNIFFVIIITSLITVLGSAGDSKGSRGRTARAFRAKGVLLQKDYAQFSH